MTAKNKRWIIALFIMIASMCFSAVAFASVSVNASPSSLSAAGDVKFTLTLKNEEAGEMEDIRIKSSLESVSFSTDGVVIAEGGEHAFSKTAAISEEMLDKPVTFNVSWTQNGEEKSKELNVTVKRTAAATSITVRRTVSSRQAAPGDTITIKYTVKNQNSTDITNVSITDKEIGGSSPIVSHITIAAGESYEYSYQYKMGYSTVISQPIVKYTSGSTTKTYEGVEPMTLGMVNTKLTVEVEQGLGTEDGVTFTIYLTNNGNQKIRDIKIVDEKGKSVNSDSFTLAVGETRSLTHKVSTEKERYVVFTITGVDASGEVYTDKTESKVVRPYIDPSSLGMEFGVAVLKTLDENGAITVRFTVNNTGSVIYTLVSVREKEVGEICKIENVAPGSHQMEETVHIGLPRDLVFTLEVTDPVGNPYTYTANLSADYIGVSDVINAPQTTDEDRNSLEDLGIAIDNAVSNTLITVLIVLGVMSALAIAALVALTSMEKKMKARAAERKRARAQGNNSTDR